MVEVLNLVGDARYGDEARLGRLLTGGSFEKAEISELRCVFSSDGLRMEPKV